MYEKLENLISDIEDLLDNNVLTEDELIEIFKTTIKAKFKSKDKPKIICICGSGRFLKQMHEIEEKLTLSNHIVLMIGVNTKDVARDIDFKKYKPMLDELHLRKIDLSDEVFIVNVDGYIGESTFNEIEYAIKQNKTINYLEG